MDITKKPLSQLTPEEAAAAAAAIVDALGLDGEATAVDIMQALADLAEKAAAGEGPPAKKRMRLTDREIAKCKKLGLDLVTYARVKHSFGARVS